MFWETVFTHRNARIKHPGAFGHPGFDAPIVLDIPPGYKMGRDIDPTEWIGGRSLNLTQPLGMNIHPKNRSPRCISRAIRESVFTQFVVTWLHVRYQHPGTFGHAGFVVFYMNSRVWERGERGKTKSTMHHRARFIVLLYFIQ